MVAKQTILTQDGLNKLETEIEYLKSVRRREVADKIKVALSFGDLSENSEYDEAKNEQGILEARIVEIESILKNVKLVDEDELSTEHVNVGNKVKLQDIEFDEIMDIQVVGSNEASPEESRISDESPIGRAIMGKSVGEIVDVEAPIGIIKFKILDIAK